jgi:putative ABC transport system permease protein
MRGTLSLVVAAAAIGAAGALMTRSFMASFLFGVRPAEPWVYGTAVAVMIGIGVIATIVPTLRALRIDPVETLRWE